MRKYNDPNTFVVEGGEWPFGPFSPDTPTYARVAAGFSRKFRLAKNGQSIRSIAREAGINHWTLTQAVNGNTVPDVGTVSMVEEVMQADLYPDRSER